MKDKFAGVLSALCAALAAAPTWTTAGILALLGLAGSATAGVIAGWLKPVLIGVSVLLLGYSFFVLYILGKGNRVSTVMTWLSLVFVIGFWTWQLVMT